jgi:hypothetical protein
MEVLSKRFAKYGLNLHPDKTKLTDFSRPAHKATSYKGPRFDFLGFTHFWARGRNGNWVVRPKTSKKSLRKTMLALDRWCRRHLHDPLDEQHKMLVIKLKGPLWQKSWLLWKNREFPSLISRMVSCDEDRVRYVK